MGDVRQLIERLRGIGQLLKYATRDGRPDECEDDSVQCYVPAAFVERIRSQCDKFLGLVEQMGITPSLLHEPQGGFPPLSRAVDHVMKIRYWGQSKTGGDTDMLFKMTQKELVQPLAEAELNLREAIRNDQISYSDDGRRLWSWMEVPDVSRDQHATGPVLQDRHRMAYRTWQKACDALGDGVRLPKDREAYDWLERCESELKSEFRYELPKFLAWQRYLRSARKRYRALKNAPPGVGKTPPNRRHFDTPQS